METPKKGYLHGYNQKETDRLIRQAGLFEPNVYADINLYQNQSVLEVGCGVGAQTEILLRRFPKIELTSIDFSEHQLSSAKHYLAKSPHLEARWSTQSMDATDMQFKGGTFDTVFICFMLEHTKKPVKVLQEALRVLKPGGKVYITEVMNFTFFLDPYSPNVWKYWMAFNDYQYEKTGDPFVGVKLGQLLKTAGYTDIQTKVLNTHIDGREPALRHQVLEDWRDLLDSSAERLIDAGYVDQNLRKEMNAGFQRAMENNHAIVYDSVMQAYAHKAK